MASPAFATIAIPLLAAIGGALAGGLPPWVLARRASKEVLARDAMARRERELGLARQVFVKLTIAVNEIMGFHRQVELMIAKADSDGNGHMPVWQRLSTFVGIDRNPVVEFDAQELSVFIAARAMDYVDALILLSRRHAAVVTSLAAFAQMRIEFQYEIAKSGNSTRNESGVSTTAVRVPPGRENYFRFKSEELSLFAENMRGLLTDYANFAARVAEKFGPISEAYFGEGQLPYLEDTPAGNDTVK